MDWFPYDRDLRREGVEASSDILTFQRFARTYGS